MAIGLHRSRLIAVLLWLIAFHAVAQDTSSAFDRLDRNKDGKLTRDELPEAIRANFDRVDSNNDGFISRDEDAAFRQRNSRVNGPRNEGAEQSTGPRLPDNVMAHLDEPYVGTDNPRQRLDLVLPKHRKGDAPLPIIVFVHGGGWRNGDKRGGLQNVLRLVETGEYAGASIGYRLSGEAIWPAQIHDCKAAIRWLRANAEQYGIDADRIAVWGSSAGGHLVAMLGTSSDVESLNGSLGEHANQSNHVACVVDYYGPTNFLTMNATAIPGATLNHDSANSPESLLIGGAIQENKEKVAAASPLTYVTKDDPPFLIVHGTADPLVSFNQSELLNEALQTAGVDVTLIPVEGAGHGGFRNPRVNEIVKLFLAKHLLKQDVDVPSEAVSSGG